MGESEFEYDPYSYEIDVDPYPALPRMRDEAPAYCNERLDFWALTRFQDCLDALPRLARPGAHRRRAPCSS